MKRPAHHIGVDHTKQMLRYLAVVLLLLFSSGLPAQTSGEYNIKAVFLYNFTQFIDWPSNAFPASDAPFIIGILGDDPFHTALDEAIAGEKVKGHPVIVQRFREATEIKNCNILFICSSEAGKVGEILRTMTTRNVLTVSDLADFTETGGIIKFMKQKNKIKLQINLAASKAAELNISSKLLQVAEIVR